MRKNTSVLRIALLLFSFILMFLLCSCSSDKSSTSNTNASTTYISQKSSNFQLRNGIKFGDTLETIKEKDDSLDPSLSIEERDSCSGNINIGGIDGSVFYTFDENSKHLVDMRYIFRPSVSDSDHNTLKESLIKKYGDPLPASNQLQNLLNGSAIERYNNLTRIMKEGEIYYSCGWLVESDDYYVKIDYVYFISSGREIDISYHYFTKEQFENALTYIQNKQNSLEDNL